MPSHIKITIKVIVKCWEVSKAKKYLARIECEGMEKAAEPL
jgi:hypothetical protein